MRRLLEMCLVARHSEVGSIGAPVYASELLT